MPRWSTLGEVYAQAVKLYALVLKRTGNGAHELRGGVRSLAAEIPCHYNRANEMLCAWERDGLIEFVGNRRHRTVIRVTERGKA